MTDIHIPPAALEAGARALHAEGDWSHIPWEELEDGDRDYYKAEARAAFVEMVGAWPGMYASPGDDHPKFGMRPHVFLPLTEKQEDGDDC